MEGLAVQARRDAAPSRFAAHGLLGLTRIDSGWTASHAAIKRTRPRCSCPLPEPAGAADGEREQRRLGDEQHVDVGTTLEHSQREHKPDRRGRRDRSDQGDVPDGGVPAPGMPHRDRREERERQLVPRALDDQPAGVVEGRVAGLRLRGTVRVSTGTLYSILDRALAEALVVAGETYVVSGRERRDYTLTPAGRLILHEESERLARAARVVVSRLRATGERAT